MPILHVCWVRSVGDVGASEKWKVVIVRREYIKVFVVIFVVLKLRECAMSRPFFEDDIAASNNRTGVPVIEFISVAPIIANEAIFNRDPVEFRGAYLCRDSRVCCTAERT